MGWGAGSCHSAGWQQEPAIPPGAGCLGMPLPVPGGLPSQRGTCLGPFPTAQTAAASTFRRWVGKAGGLPYRSRPSPTPTPCLVLLGGGNAFHWDKGAFLSPQSAGEPPGSAHSWDVPGSRELPGLAPSRGAHTGVSHFGGVPSVIPALGMVGTGLSRCCPSPAPLQARNAMWGCSSTH